MTAKVASHDGERKDWLIVALKMAAAEILYKWSTAVLQSGYAQTNDWTTNTLDAGDKFAWIVVEEIDNSAWANGDLNVRVYTDWNHVVDVVDTITQANVGDTVYINNTSDDAAVTINTDAGVDLEVGYIVEFIWANKARIAIRNGVWNIAS